MSDDKTSDLLKEMAAAAKVEPVAYLAALQRVAGCQSATTADFLALLYAAHKYGLDPLLRQIGLMDTKHGPRIYVGIDAWVRLLIEHPDYLMYRHEDVWSGGTPGKGTIEAVTVSIYRKSWKAQGLPPFVHTEYLRECRRDTGPWSSHPARMLLERAIGQATRFCFGMYIPEADELGKMDDVAVERGEVARTGAPTNLTPAIVVQATVMPSSSPATQEVPALPTDTREVVDVGAAVRVPEPAQKARLPEYDKEASLAADRAAAAEENGTTKGAFDDLDFG